MAKRPRARRVRVKEGRVVVERDWPNLSETLLAFAKPLLESLPGDPPTLDQVRLAMHFASIVWNVHVLAKDDPGFGAEVCAALDEVPEDLGPNATAVLDDMLTSRKTTYAEDPRLASVEVVEAEGGWTVRTQSAIVD